MAFLLLRGYAAGAVGPMTVEPLLGVPRMGPKTPNGNEEIYLGWKGYSWKDLIE